MGIFIFWAVLKRGCYRLKNICTVTLLFSSSSPIQWSNTKYIIYSDYSYLQTKYGNTWKRAPEEYPRPLQTSKMGSFVIIVNDSKLLTIAKKLSILDFCRVLATPLCTYILLFSLNDGNILTRKNVFFLSVFFFFCWASLQRCIQKSVKHLRLRDLQQ